MRVIPNSASIPALVATLSSHASDDCKSKHQLYHTRTIWGLKTHAGRQVAPNLDGWPFRPLSRSLLGLKIFGATVGRCAPSCLAILARFWIIYPCARTMESRIYYHQANCCEQRESSSDMSSRRPGDRFSSAPRTQSPSRTPSSRSRQVIDTPGMLSVCAIGMYCHPLQRFCGR